MRAAFYCDLILNRIDFEGARDIYLEWALGIRRFSQSAESRMSGSSGNRVAPKLAEETPSQV